MLKCSQVPEELEKKNLSSLAWISLRFHLFICSRCRQLQRQMRSLDQMLARRQKQVKPISKELVDKIKFNHLNK